MEPTEYTVWHKVLLSNSLGDFHGMFVINLNSAIRIWVAMIQSE